MDNLAVNETTILDRLKAPFHPANVTWKVKEVASNGKKALAVAYVDVIAYHNRLDEVNGLDWAVSYTPWGERIVCHLTVNGVTRSAAGETTDHDTAEVVAFKKACSMFGLGRYLSNIPPVWVEYDKDAKGLSFWAQTKLEGIVVQHYRRHMQSTEAV